MCEEAWRRNTGARSPICGNLCCGRCSSTKGWYTTMEIYIVVCISVQITISLFADNDINSHRCLRSLEIKEFKERNKILNEGMVDNDGNLYRCGQTTISLFAPECRQRYKFPSLCTTPSCSIPTWSTSRTPCVRVELALLEGLLQGFKSSRSPSRRATPRVLK